MHATDIGVSGSSVSNTSLCKYSIVSVFDDGITPFSHGFSTAGKSKRTRSEGAMLSVRDQY
jgi:hypothetical protein